MNRVGTWMFGGRRNAGLRNDNRADVPSSEREYRIVQGANHEPAVASRLLEKLGCWCRGVGAGARRVEGRRTADGFLLRHRHRAIGEDGRSIVSAGDGDRLGRLQPFLGRDAPRQRGVPSHAAARPRPGHHLHRHGRFVRFALNGGRRHQGCASRPAYSAEQDLAPQGALGDPVRRRQAGGRSVPQGSRRGPARRVPDPLHDRRQVARPSSSGFATSCPT